jgi:RNA recognition motif-containing protein
MGNRLYVGNLPFHATEELIKQKFGSCGEVKEVSLMLDRMTGQSRGFCFVEMATPEGAQKALDELNQQDFEGRSLRVDVAQERSGGGGGGGGGRGGGGGGRGGGGGGGGGGRGPGGPGGSGGGPRGGSGGGGAGGGR